MSVARSRIFRYGDEATWSQSRQHEEHRLRPGCCQFQYVPHISLYVSLGMFKTQLSWRSNSPSWHRFCRYIVHTRTDYNVYPVHLLSPRKSQNPEPVPGETLSSTLCVQTVPSACLLQCQPLNPPSPHLENPSSSIPLYLSVLSFIHCFCAFEPPRLGFWYPTATMVINCPSTIPRCPVHSRVDHDCDTIAF